MKKYAFITGGVGKIGSEICVQLAEQGYIVVFSYRFSKDNDIKAIDLLAKMKGDEHISLVVDITDVERYTLMVETLMLDIPHIDLVVNCAGTTKFVAPERLDLLDEHLIDKIFQVNVRSAITTIKLFKSFLDKAPAGGCIINISSIAAKTAIGSNIAYCASKAAMDNLTLSLARALGPKIRVFSISPGLADTDFVKGVNNNWRNEQLDKTPLQRLVSPKEVAEAVLVATEKLLFSTGIILPVDGGRPLN